MIKYESDLINDVLYTLVVQQAAKILEVFRDLWVSVGQSTSELQAVKLGGQEKSRPLSPARTGRVQSGLKSKTK